MRQGGGPMGPGGPSPVMMSREGPVYMGPNGPFRMGPNGPEPMHMMQGPRLDFPHNFYFISQARHGPNEVPNGTTDVNGGSYGGYGRARAYFTRY